MEDAMAALRATDDRLMENVREMGERARRVQQQTFADQEARLKQMRANSRGECPECDRKGTVPTTDAKGTIDCPQCHGSGKLLPR